MTKTTFDEWWARYTETDGREVLSEYEKDVARDAFNAAIEECAKAIEPANHPLLMAATNVIRALKQQLPQKDDA